VKSWPWWITTPEFLCRRLCLLISRSRAAAAEGATACALQILGVQLAAGFVVIGIRDAEGAISVRHL
jgi:hypothetical protein